MKRYAVHDVFDTIQGEGMHSGRRAVFVRLAGCNLWNGEPAHRAGRGACAAWCDTDFAPRERLTAPEIAERVDALWAPTDARVVVLTGGEPLLQLDQELFGALAPRGMLHVETNGTFCSRVLQSRSLFVTLSPKLDPLGAPLALAQWWADELKVVLPGHATTGWTDAALVELADQFPDASLYVQPQDGHVDGVSRCVDFVRQHPNWRVSVQTHKVLGVP